MILALKTYSGLLIFVTHESLSLLFSCHWLPAEYQELHDNLLLTGEVS